jgi:hypothetical protein
MPLLHAISDEDELGDVVLEIASNRRCFGKRDINALPTPSPVERVNVSGSPAAKSMMAVCEACTLGLEVP